MFRYNFYNTGKQNYIMLLDLGWMFAQGHFLEKTIWFEMSVSVLNIYIVSVDRINISLTLFMDPHEYNFTNHV